MYDRITLTTDLSPASQTAFFHALALALQYRTTLDILHVRDPADEVHWQEFPQVRATLQKWGIANLPSVLPHGGQIAGITVNKIDVPANDPAARIGRFMQQHGTALMVAAAHGRGGVSRLLHGSVTERLRQETGLPCLLFGPHATPFVSPEDGFIAIERVVLPLAADPPPEPAYDELVQLLGGPPKQLLPLHVLEEPSGFDGGTFEGAAVHVTRGPVAETIARHAAEKHAQLIVMASKGPHGLRDRLFGSTASQVLAKAPCPVLLVPAAEAR